MSSVLGHQQQSRTNCPTGNNGSTNAKDGSHPVRAKLRYAPCCFAVGIYMDERAVAVKEVESAPSGSDPVRKALKRRESLGPRLRLRTAQPEDAAALAHTDAEVAAEPGRLLARPHEIRARDYAVSISRLVRKGHHLVADDGNHIVGHGSLAPMKALSTTHVFRLNIVVHPQYQSRGVGATLLEALLSWARRERRVEKVELLVRATNERAIKLCQRFGFVEEGRLRYRVKVNRRTYIDDVSLAWFPRRPGTLRETGRAIASRTATD